MSAIARGRLAEERKAWRRDHPYGFVAKPQKRSDGTQDLFRWDCIIPGPAASVWEGAKLKLVIEFGNDYPTTAPVVKFVPVLWHMNVWSSGRICLNILNPDDGTWHGKWRASTTVKQILLGVQSLLDNPNPAGARPEVENLWRSNRAEYEKRLEREADKYKTPD